MIDLMATGEGRFSIGHVSSWYPSGVWYTFDQTFLPDHVMAHVRTLALHAGMRRELRYGLTADQNYEVARIFMKLDGEARSDYMFSLQLQKTYLVELIHFITRLNSAG